MANAPSVAVWALLYILQSPTVLVDVLAEIDARGEEAPLDIANLSTDLPLLSSCLTETLRLATSSFSIRVVQADFFLPLGATDGEDKKAEAVEAAGCVIPAGSKIVCATRVSHLDEESWGSDAAAWDGKRFFDRPGEGTERSKRVREVRGFGGGISIVRSSFLSSFLRLWRVGLTSFEITTVRRPEPRDRGAQGVPCARPHGLRL